MTDERVPQRIWLSPKTDWAYSQQPTYIYNESNREEDDIEFVRAYDSDTIAVLVEALTYARNRFYVCDDLEGENKLNAALAQVEAKQ